METVADGNYRTLFSNSPIPIALVSARGDPTFVAASRGFLEAVRLKPADVVGRRLDQVFVLGSGARVLEPIERCLVSAESARAHASVADGPRTRRVRLAVHAADAEGFAGHVMLEIQRERHADPLFDLVEDDRGLSLTYTNDLKTGQVRYTTSGLARRLGLSPSGEMQNDALWAITHPDDVARTPAHEAVRHELRDDEFVGSTLRVRDREGEWRLVNFRARVLQRDAEGGVRTMVGVATDITAYTSDAIEAAGLSTHGVEENERARIGRELHDSTSQFLVAADLGVGQILRGEEVPDDLRERLSGVRASLAAAQTEMRAFTFFLHPPELREFGLFKTLEKFCAGFARRSGIAISFTGKATPERLPPEVEHAFLRVCQEALMNVYRHAFARSAAVSLIVRGHELILEVRDDGVGVDGVDRFDQGGMGVAGMRARMRGIGGDLELCLAGPGLTIVARAPVAGPE